MAEYTCSVCGWHYAGNLVLGGACPCELVMVWDEQRFVPVNRAELSDGPWDH